MMKDKRNYNKFKINKKKQKRCTIKLNSNLNMKLLINNENMNHFLKSLQKLLNREIVYQNYMNLNQIF